MDIKLHSIEDLINFCLKRRIGIQIQPLNSFYWNAYGIQVDKGDHHVRVVMDGDITHDGDATFNMALNECVDKILAMEKYEEAKKEWLRNGTSV